ncbi:MAG: hypothetical protein AAF789_11340, partial [Bacteroidota bacterium]
VSKLADSFSMTFCSEMSYSQLMVPYLLFFITAILCPSLLITLIVIELSNLIEEPPRIVPELVSLFLQSFPLSFSLASDF